MKVGFHLERQYETLGSFGPLSAGQGVADAFVFSWPLLVYRIGQLHEIDVHSVWVG